MTGLEPMLIGAAISAITPLIAEAFASGDRARAESLRQQAMQQYNVPLPPIEAIAVQSQAAMAKGDEAARASRAEALRAIAQRGREGFTVEDRAATAAMLGDVAAQERGAREAILRKLPAQSGARVAALLSNQQAAAQQASQAGLDLAAQSRRQALQALASQGQLAGQMEESAFEQAYRRGQAADAIARFNAENQMAAQAGRRADALRQQEARAAAMLGQADIYGGRSARVQSGIGGTGQAVGSALGTYGMMQYLDEGKNKTGKR